MASEQLAGAAGQLEELDAFVDVAPVGVAMLLDREFDSLLFAAPLGSLAFEEGGLDSPVQLVNVHRVEPVLK